MEERKVRVAQRVAHIVFLFGADANSVYNAFDWIYNILSQLEEIVGLAEAVLDVFTVIEEWNDGDYFEAGLFTGKGIVGLFFTVWALI